MTATSESTLILIPAYNAEHSLPELFARIRQSLGTIAILVVDDGSQDRTSSVAQAAGVQVLIHKKNLGKGAALQTGFDAIRTMPGIDFILTMDADLQHRPEDIAGFMERQHVSDGDIIIGWRQRIGTGMPLARILSNTITSAMVGMRTGQIIKDSQCGFRLLQRRVIENIRTERAGYEAETELLIKAAKRGMKIDFVPVQTVYGAEKSYMTHWATTKNFIKVLFRDYV